MPLSPPLPFFKVGKTSKFFFLKGGRGGGRILVGSTQEGDIFLLVATLMSEREGGGAAMRVLREREECFGYGNRICACVCVCICRVDGARTYCHP